MDYKNQYFDMGINRRGTRCEKWDDITMCGQDTLPFWVADMDFACAKPIQDALVRRAEHACYGYTRIEDDDLSAFRDFWKRRHSLNITQKQSIMLPCVVTGLRTCIRQFTRPGEGVIIQTPVYGPFYSAVTDNSRVVLPAPLRRDDMNRYHMDLNTVEMHLQNGAKLMIICNPHNPVSRLWTHDELQDLVKLLAQYNARLVSDEIHADFVYSGSKFVPILSLPDAHEIALSLASASKTYNIAGLQQATAVCFNRTMLDLVSAEIRAAGIVSGNLFALEATRAAYELGDEWLDSLLLYLDENRSIVKNAINTLLPNAKLTPIEATFLAWIDLSNYGQSADDLITRTKARGVALSDGTFFGKEDGKGFMRLNFACPQSMLREGMQRLAMALN